MLWLPRLGTSLWLDETGTAWVVSGSLPDAVERARFQGQTPAYYVIAWLARAAFGSSEVALRIPSLLGMALAAFFVYRIGRRLADRETGLLAAVAFVALPQIVFSATDARPYALALATSTGSTLALLAWIDDRRRSALIVWALTAAATISLTYMFAVALIPQAIYVGARWRDVRERARDLVLAIVGAGILLLPAVPMALDLLGREGVLAWAREGVSYKRYLLTLIPPVVAAGAAIGIVASAILGRVWAERPPARARDLILPAAWALVPLTVFLLLGLAFSGKLFQPRYYLSAYPGIALLAGIGLRALTPPRARALAAIAIVAVAALTYDDAALGRQDWRGAAAAVNRVVEDPGTPVLVHTGFATQRRPEDPGGELLLAPLTVYPMEGEPIHLPFDITPETEATLGRIARARLAGAERFVLVQSFDVAPFRAWFEQHLQGDLSVTTVFMTRNLRVDLFERRA